MKILTTVVLLLTASIADAKTLRFAGDLSLTVCKRDQSPQCTGVIDLRRPIDLVLVTEQGSSIETGYHPLAASAEGLNFAGDIGVADFTPHGGEYWVAPRVFLTAANGTRRLVVFGRIRLKDFSKLSYTEFIGEDIVVDENTFVQPTVVVAPYP